MNSLREAGRGGRRPRGNSTVGAVVGLCAVSLLMALAGCQKKTPDLSRATAEQIYLARCSRCHETDGSSATASAKSDHDIDFRGSEFQLTFDDAAIRKIATFGQGKMQGISGITETELDSVVVYVRRLGRAGGEVPPPADGP